MVPLENKQAMQQLYNPPANRNVLDQGVSLIT